MTQVQDTAAMDAEIRNVLAAHARLSGDAQALNADADLSTRPA
jgi:hypothetical protein